MPNLPSVTDAEAAELRRRWSSGDPYDLGPDVLDGLRLLAERERQAAEIERLREAIKLADGEVSVVHDAIWSTEVGSAMVLHDNDDPKSAQSAIWRVHGILRAALGEEER